MEQKIVEVCRDFLTAALDLLSELINKPIDVENIDIKEGSLQDAIFNLPEDVLVIPLKFSGDIEGQTAFALSQAAASRIAAYLMGSDGIDEKLSEDSIANVTDAFSQLGVVMSNSLSASLNTGLQSEIGQSAINSLNLATLFAADEVVHCAIRARVDGADLNLDYFAPKSMEEKMNASILSAVQPESAGIPDEKVAAEPVYDDRTIDLTGVASDAGPSGAELLGSFKDEKSEMKFPEFSQESSTERKSSKNIDMLMDVPLEVTVELGRTKMSIKDLLDLGEGSIIELDKLAGEPVDFLVNGQLISRGEVVVIDENFGVRITEIVSPADRLSSL
jgi:flagellar motor switch protein FliN/FliY